MSYGGSSGQESDKNGIFIFCYLFINKYYLHPKYITFFKNVRNILPYIIYVLLNIIFFRVFIYGQHSC